VRRPRAGAGVFGRPDISAYHQLWHVEHAFRMSKHDLRARPIYHHKRESIDAHLAIVFAALAVSHWIEQRTGWTIKRFVQTLRRHRVIVIRAGTTDVTAQDPIPDDVAEMLDRLKGHQLARVRSMGPAAQRAPMRTTGARPVLVRSGAAEGAPSAARLPPTHSVADANQQRPPVIDRARQVTALRTSRCSDHA